MTDTGERPAWLRSEVQKVLGRVVDSIRWDTLGFNNHLAIVSLVPLSTDSESIDNLADPAANEIVVRIPKQKSSNANPRGKVENEVAALQLARAHGIPCPRVIHYSSDPLYMIQDRLPGIPVKEVWHLMTDDQRATLCTSLANVFHALRSIPLPGAPGSSRSAYGGLQLKNRGIEGVAITIGPNPLGFTEPTFSLRDHLRSFFDWQMQLARANPFLHGWSYRFDKTTSEEQSSSSNQTGSNGASLADRLGSFAADPERGLDSVLLKLETDAGEFGHPVFVHGDFDLHNVLLDRETHQMTGLVDFEYARAAPAWEEHFDGLFGVGHGHSGPEEDDPALVRHGKALLEPKGWASESNPIPPSLQTGKVDHLSGEEPEDMVTWHAVHTWDRACEAAGVVTPREMNVKAGRAGEGTFALASRLHWFISAVCPWQLEDAKAELDATRSGSLDELPDERRAWVVRKRGQAAQRLDRFLTFWGF